MEEINSTRRDMRASDLIKSVEGILSSEQSWFSLGQVLLAVSLFAADHHSNGRHFLLLLICYCLLLGHLLSFYPNHLGTAHRVNISGVL